MLLVKRKVLRARAAAGWADETVQEADTAPSSAFSRKSERSRTSPPPVAPLSPLPLSPRATRHARAPRACSTCTTKRNSGSLIVLVAIAFSSVLLPTPLRPTRPYLVPYVSARVPLAMSSSLPPWRTMPVTEMSMFRVERRHASGPEGFEQMGVPLSGGRTDCVPRRRRRHPSYEGVYGGTRNVPLLIKKPSSSDVGRPVPRERELRFAAESPALLFEASAAAFARN